MMLGWSSLAEVFASCWKRRTIWSSCATSGGNTLIATSRSSVRSCARNTAPIPPLPNNRSIRYLPSTRRPNRSAMTSVLLVLAPPPVPAPEISAPHDEQNRLLSGIGVWQRKHSSTPLGIGAGAEGGGACVAERAAESGGAAEMAGPRGHGNPWG